MNRSLAILVALGLAMTAGAAERQTFKHKHIPPAVAGLTPIGDLEPTNKLHLAICLPVRNQPALDALMADLYNPASPRYRHWLTNGEFADKFGPTTNDYESVVSWALSNGFSISSRYGNRSHVSVIGDVPTVEKAFVVKLKKYRHPHDTRNFYAPDREPAIDLGIPLSGIVGLDSYGKIVSTIAKSKATPTTVTGSGPGGSFIGYDFRRAYVPGTALTGAGQNVGSVQFDYFNVSDIIAYRTAAGLPSITIVSVPVDGGSPVGADTGETCLDIEMQYSMAPGCTIYVYYAPNGPSTLWNDMMSTIATRNECKQISCSWADFSGTNYMVMNPSYYSFEQMAAQGQSFFTSSGDYGAYVYDDGTYVPYPAVFTNITVVGGTDLAMNGSGLSYASETAWNRNNGWATGGGVNLFYNIPDYQLGMSWTANLGDPTSRNLPDVAMVADNVYVYAQGAGTVEGGTSASTPLWAGLCALMNQQSVATSGTTVGWLNPSIYNIGKGTSYTACFHDITVGNNYWSGSPSYYPAVAGYDLCTGWGSPIGTSLINALTSPVIVTNGFTLIHESCTPTNNAIDPGETVTNSLSLKNIGSFNTINLVVTLLAGGGVSSPSPAQTYGVLTAGGAAVAKPFGFVAVGFCGYPATATFQLQDGAVNLGTVTVPFQMGAFVRTTNVLSQNFDGVTAPALPAGWTTASSGSQVGWTTSTTTNDTAPNAVFVLDDPGGGVSELYSPTFTLATGNATISFRQWYMMESGPGPAWYDGGVLDININSTGWLDIVSAGGSFISGGYIGALNTHYSNPLAGRMAWSGISPGFITTAVSLNVLAAGTVQLRWRYGGDVSIGKPGWYVDTVSVVNQVYSCCH